MVPYVLQIAIISEVEADKIIMTLLDNKFACCCQKVKVQSNYNWDGQYEYGDEFLLIIKTFEHLIEYIEKVCEEEHSYEIYQITGYKMTYVNEKYLQWMKNECKQK